MNRDNKDKLSKTFSEIYSMQFLTSFVATAIYILLAFLLLKEYRTFSIILTLYVASCFTDINWFYHGLEKFKVTVIGNSIIKIISVACVFLFIKSESDLWVYILIHSLATFLSSIVLWFYLRHYVTFKIPKLRDILKHFKPNLVLFIPVIAVSVYKYMDKIMLGNYSVVENGYYEQAEKLITLVAGFITSFGTVMLPKASNLVANNNIAKVQRTIKDSMRFVMGLSFAFAFGLSSIATVFVPLYFGKEFEPCIVLIYSLSSTLVFTSWSTVVRTQYLIPLGKNKVYLIAEFLGAFVNLFLNILLIPKFGALGAVVGTIMAELSVTFYQTIAIRRNLTTVTYIIESIPFVAIGIAMFALAKKVFSFINNPVFSLLIAICIGAVFYISAWFFYEKQLRAKERSSAI